MSLKILVSPGNFVPENGGAWTFTSQIADALKTYPTQHQFIVLDESDPQERSGPENRGHGSILGNALQKVVRQAVDSGRKVAPAGLRRGINSLRPRRRQLSVLQAAIKAAQPDIVWHLHQAAIPSDVPFIVTVWDVNHRKIASFPDIGDPSVWLAREQLYRASLPRASFLISGTEVGKQDIMQFYGVDERNIRVIPYPAPKGQIRRPVSRDPAALRKFGINGDFIFYPAQFWPHKNHFNLVRAVGILRNESGIRVNLVLTGRDKGNLDYVQETVRNLDLSNQVFHLGFVSRDEVELLYQNAVALVYPSFNGPDNLPPLEAFAWGCPVIAADIPGATEQLGSAALFCNPTDPIDIAAKIRTLLENDTCRCDLIAAGASIAAARTPQAYISKMNAIFDEFEPIRRCWGANYSRQF
jgi:glycosyltransferase involved in cell wall biosynthesis